MWTELKLSRFLTWAALALVLLAGSTVSAFANKRVALVIGNAAYQNATPLLNPGRDATALGEMFKKAGFDIVSVGTDLTSLEFKRRVREFSTIARDSDIAVVFFAGHGIEVNANNYLIPIDAKLASDFDADDEGVSLERIIRTIEPARRLRLVILDACRDNPFISKMQRTVSVRAVTNGLAKIEPSVGDTLVAYAAKAGSTAEDGYGNHSPFTTALLKHLSVPGLDIRIAFGRVRDDVFKATRGKQEPFVYGSLGGTHITLVPEQSKAAPPPPVADTHEIRTRYEFAERVGTKAAWDYFLAAHPNGLYADLARAQLAKMAAAAPAGAVAPETAAPFARQQDAGPPPVAKVTPPAPPRQDDQARANAAAAEARLKTEREAKVKAETDAKLKTELEAEEKRKTVAAVAPPPPPPPPPPRSCGQDEETLARLRSTRNADDIVRFERELFCLQLRPQLMRLKESVVGLTPPAAATPSAVMPPPAVATPAPAAPVVAAPSLPKGLSPTRPSPSGEAESSAPSPVASAQPQDACQRDEERLSRLRTSRVAEEIVLFSRELTCERLRPQLLRLRESVVGR